MVNWHIVHKIGVREPREGEFGETTLMGEESAFNLCCEAVGA